MTDETSRTATCGVCGGSGTYYTYRRWNGVEDELLDAWWAHDVHPADNHDFAVGDV